MSSRRTFIARMGALAATGLTLDADELRASTAPVAGPWDTSWLDKLATAKYKVVFNANNLSSCTLGAFSGGTTTATCSGLSQSTATATTLAVAVR